MGFKLWKDNPHNVGAKHPRDVLNAMKEGEVEWTPYTTFLPLAPSCVLRDQGVWLARVPLVHFWIVSHHYPDRVMRQYGLLQTVPPPPPLSWDVHRQLDEVDHTDGHYGLHWGERHADYVGQWSADRVPLCIVPTDGQPHDSDWWFHQYMPWYERFGMRSIYLERDSTHDLTQPLPPPSQPPSSLTYVSHSECATRQVSDVI